LAILNQKLELKQDEVTSLVIQRNTALESLNAIKHGAMAAQAEAMTVQNEFRAKAT
jgi:hypothetical protein